MMPDPVDDPLFDAGEGKGEKEGFWRSGFVVVERRRSKEEEEIEVFLLSSFLLSLFSFSPFFFPPGASQVREAFFTDFPCPHVCRYTPGRVKVGAASFIGVAEEAEFFFSFSRKRKRKKKGLEGRRTREVFLSCFLFSFFASTFLPAAPPIVEYFPIFWQGERKGMINLLSFFSLRCLGALAIRGEPRCVQISFSFSFSFSKNGRKFTVFSFKN